MRPIAFNGKFLTAAPTGVHRVAEELIKAFDTYISEDQHHAIDAAVFAPKTSRRRLPLIRTELRAAGRLSGVLKNIPWEQLTLPWLARKSILINLCNLGPVLHRNSVTMIHDAQVYETPKSYSLGFRLWYKFLQPLLGRTNKQILTVSEYSKRQLVMHGVAPADKISVIPNGCDHNLHVIPDENFVKEAGLIPHRYVLALATTQAHKNIRLLLKAFESDRLSDMTLVLFGSETAKGFERQGFTVPRNVRFLGRITDEQLTALTMVACAFACPSTTEGFGLPPLEAMILGCPAIIAPCGALPEVCGDAALVAGPEDADAWIDSIRSLSDDPGLRSLVIERGRQRAAMYTWKAAAHKLASALGLLPRAEELEYARTAPYPEAAE